MSNRIYTKEEMKEINKKVRALAKVSHLHEEFSHYSDKNITKVTVQKILDFRKEPFYADYLAIATPEIEKLKIIPPEENPIFEKVKPLIVECIKEERLERDIEKEIRKMDREEIAKKMNEFNVDNTYDLGRKIISQKNPQSSCDKLEKEIKTMQSEKPITKSMLNDYYHKQFLGIITPDLTPEDIKTKRPNFDRGLLLFLDNFKEEVKESSKESEWNKQFLSRDIQKRYFNTLKTMVDTNEVKARVEQAFIKSIQNKTKYALNHYDEMAQRKSELRAKFDTLQSERDQIHKKYPTLFKLMPEYDTISGRLNGIRAEMKQIDSFLSEVSNTIHSFDQIIKTNWDKQTQSFTKHVEIEAKQETETTITEFVYKNTEKMARILAKREDCDTFEPKLNYDNIMIEGNIHVRCKNGDEFRVNNQLVFVPEGEKRAHYRFPTTFHDVKVKGKVVKMFSEQEMNQIFTNME